VSQRQNRSSERLNAIYDRTRGRCHICGRRVAFRNYGILGAHMAWEIEHSRARALGGTDRLSNLYPAHISCNRSKGTASTRTARSWHGRRRAPMSVARRASKKRENAMWLGLLGVAIGAKVAGRRGAVVGGLLGAAFGHDLQPRDL